MIRFWAANMIFKNKEILTSFSTSTHSWKFFFMETWLPWHRDTWQVLWRPLQKITFLDLKKFSINDVSLSQSQYKFWPEFFSFEFHQFSTIFHHVLVPKNISYDFIFNPTWVSAKIIRLGSWTTHHIKSKYSHQWHNRESRNL